MLGKTPWLQTTSGGEVHRGLEGVFSRQFSNGNHQDYTGVCSLRWVTFGQFLIKILSHSGKQKINIGNFSSFKSDEEIQQRKFLSLVNTLTINLLHSILTQKMDYGKAILNSQIPSLFISGIMEVSRHFSLFQQKEYTLVYSKLYIHYDAILNYLFLHLSVQYLKKKY